MPRVGIDRMTGRALTGWDHCAQSIGDIVSTLIGERVEMRDYGSDAPGLQDRPGNQASIVRHFSAIAQAIWRWEPGYRLRRVSLTDLDRDGLTGFRMEGDFYPRGHLGDYSVVEAGRSLLVPLGRVGALA